MDWMRISLSLIRKEGGQGLLSKYDNSLLRALKTIYPYKNWSEFTLSPSIQHHISFPQQIIVKYLKNNFHIKDILMNFKHPGLYFILN